MTDNPHHHNPTKARLLEVLRRRGRGQTFREIGQAITPKVGVARARELYLRALYLWNRGWLG